MSERQMADRAFQGGAASVVETAAVKVVISNIRNEYENQLAAVRAEIKQQDSDWLAMLKAIVALDPTSEWSEAHDDDLWEQFDPWQALRELAGEWERVPDGTYVTKHGDGIISYGNDQLSISQRKKRMTIFVGTLPEGWELRRRVKKEPTP